MTDNEAVALDALRALGLTHVNLWHLRCLDAALAQGLLSPGADRLVSDIRHESIDTLRETAESEPRADALLRSCCFRPAIECRCTIDERAARHRAATEDWLAGRGV